MKVGETIDGKTVHGGMYKYCGTHGLPLGILLDTLKSWNAVIDWQDFIADMSREGAKKQTIRARILEAVELPPKEKQVFKERLDKLLSQ